MSSRSSQPPGAGVGPGWAAHPAQPVATETPRPAARRPGCTPMRRPAHTPQLGLRGAQTLYGMSPQSFWAYCQPYTLDAVAQSVVLPGDSVPAGKTRPNQARAPLQTPSTPAEGAGHGQRVLGHCMQPRQAGPCPPPPRRPPPGAQGAIGQA